MNSSAPKSSCTSFPVHVSENTSTKREKGERSRISVSRKLSIVLRHGRDFGSSGPSSASLAVHQGVVVPIW